MNTAHQLKDKQTEAIEHWSLCCIMNSSVVSYFKLRVEVLSNNL